MKITRLTQLFCYPHQQSACLSILLFWLFVSSTLSWAQTPVVDRLKKELATHSQLDTGRVNRLNSLSRAVSNPTQGIELAKEARQLAERLGYSQGVAQADMNTAWQYTSINDCKQACVYAQRAYRRYTTLTDRSGEVNSLTQLAYIYIALGDYVQSIGFAQQALALVEPMPDKSRKAYVNLLLSQLQAHLGNYDKARIYAQTGLKLAQEAHNPVELSRGLNILGEIHRMRGEWANALRYYKLDLQQQKDHTLNKAICEGNIADVSDRLGAYSEAFRYGQSVLTYCRELKATSYIAWIEGVLSRIYLHTGRTNEAIAYASRSFQVAKRGGLRKIASEAAEVLSLAYARQGKYTKSYQYERHYAALKDSLRSEEIIRQTTALQFKYDLEKQQSEIALLTKNRQIEHEESRYQRGLLYASLIGLGLLLALAVVLFLNNRNKQRVNALLADQKQFIETQLTAELAVRQQELLTTQLRAQQEELRAAQAQLRLKEEKERIARDLHDHVGAQLSVIAASASGNSADAGLNSSIGSYAREAIQSLRDTVWAIDQSSVSLGDFRTKLQQYLNRQQQLHPACTYILDCQVSANPLLTSAQALNLFRQAQEAVHNAFKYAQASQVVAECQLVDELFTLNIRDNGVGFEPALTIDEQPRYGLRNLHRRAEELHGTCQIDTAPGHGTCVRITVPLSA